MSTSEAEPYIARNISEESISRTPVELQAVLFSSSSISILPSVEVISMASRRATRRAHLLSLSSPFPARHPQTQRALVTGGQAASSPTQQSGSERRAARCGPGEAVAVARRGTAAQARKQSTRSGFCGAEKHRIAAPRRDLEREDGVDTLAVLSEHLRHNDFSA